MTEKPGDTMSPESAPGKRRHSREILVNTISSYGRDLVDGVVLLVLTPFLISSLGKETFGLWSLIWSFLGLFELLDIGLGPSVVKFVADARGKQDPERERKLVCTLFWVYVGLGSLVMLGISASLLFFNELFDIPAAQRAPAQVVLLLLGFRGAISFPLGMFRGVLIGHQKMFVANLYRALGSLLYLGAVLLALRQMADIRLLAALNVGYGVLPKLAMMWHIARTAPQISMRPRHFEPGMIREVAGFSMSYVLIQISGIIYVRIGALITKLFLPLSAVAVWAIAARLAEKSRQLCLPLIRNMAPVVAELHGARDEVRIRLLWERGTKLSVALAIPLLLGLAILARPLIDTWVGPGFEEAVPALWWLIGAAFVGILHGNSRNLLTMGGQHAFVAWTRVGSQVVSLALALVLIRERGIVGVAMASFIAELPFQAGVMQTRAGQLYGRSHLVFYSRTLLPSLVPAALMSGTLFGLQRVWDVTHLAEVALLELIAIAVFGVSFWAIGLSGKERTYFAERIFRRGRKGD